MTIETLSLPFIALHHYNTVQVITDNLVRELTEPNYGTENIKYQINKLEECRLQGVRKLAVNANVSG